MTRSDTIVAIATPPGRGAVGIVRLSGPEVPRIARACSGRCRSARARHAARAFSSATARRIDAGIALYFPAPASFTGEHVLELQGARRRAGDATCCCAAARAGRAHGAARRIQRARLPERQDGSRAGRSGRRSDRCRHGGRRARGGALDAGRVLGAHRARSASCSRSCASHVEAAIDFPDEEIDFLAGAGASPQRLERVLARSMRSRPRHAQGALLREGLTVVIAGRPNAGKSSLLNRLAGDDVAIVTASPGTTRDVLRQQLHLDGMPSEPGRHRGTAQRRRTRSRRRASAARAPRCSAPTGCCTSSMRARADAVPRGDCGSCRAGCRMTCR